jgi:predicted RNA-binding Zn ribbon-like protein
MRVLPLVLVAAIAVGCGSGGSANYDDELAKSEAVVQEALTDLGSDSAELDASSKAIAGAARELDASKPPGDEQHYHDEYVAALREIARTLHQAAEAGRTGRFKQRDDVLEHIDSSPGLRRLRALVRELDS